MEDIKKAIDKFYIGESTENVKAEITFTEKDTDVLVIEHTRVSEELKGQGIGLKLVRKVAEYARQESKKIKPVCTFAKKVMTENDEYKDVLIETD
jgi:predicted GNAT family acetyltransferase